MERGSATNFSKYSQGMDRLRRFMPRPGVRLLVLAAWGICAWYSHTVLVIATLAALFIAGVASDLVDGLIVTRAEDAGKLEDVEKLRFDVESLRDDLEKGRISISASSFRLVNEKGEVVARLEVDGLKGLPTFELCAEGYGRISMGFDDNGNAKLDMHDRDVSCDPSLSLEVCETRDEADEVMGGKECWYKTAGLTVNMSDYATTAKGKAELRLVPRPGTTATTGDCKFAHFGILREMQRE